MTPDLVRRLNHLNRDFYQKIATDFDATRQEYWPGWLELVPQLQASQKAKGSLNVLDLGCGNGRFGQFLAEHLEATKIHYTGSDLNSVLLEKAQLKLAATDLKTTFITQDLVALALEKQISTAFAGQTFDVICLLGVLHHVPSFELRTQLLSNLAELLSPQGLLIFTTWQFMEFGRIKDKRVDPSLVGFDADELEENDFFLDWERGQVAYRYCHYFNEQEHHRLINSLHPQAQLVNQFRADGKEGNMDQYFVFQRV